MIEQRAKQRNSTYASDELDEETRSLMDKIYKEIENIQKSIKLNEEEVQYSMIKWNTTIIKHEKMNKFREDITSNLVNDKTKLS